MKPGVEMNALLLLTAMALAGEPTPEAPAEPAPTGEAPAEESPTPAEPAEPAEEADAAANPWATVPAAAPAPAPAAPLRLDRGLYDRQMRVARIGLALGGGGLVVATGGIALWSYGLWVAGGEVAVTGALLAGVGATGLLVGPPMTVAGSLYAAARLEDAGLRIDKSAGWVGLAILVAGVAIPGAYWVSYLGSGIQMAMNAQALRDAGLRRRGRTPLAFAYDPRTRTVHLGGRF